MSDSVGGRRRVLGGVLLAVQSITTCVAASAVPFVVSSLVGLLSIIAALWVLLPGAAGSRTAGLLGVMALAIIAAGIVAIITSPTGPFRTFPATQTANPVQIPAPTRGP